MIKSSSTSILCSTRLLYVTPSLYITDLESLSLQINNTLIIEGFFSKLQHYDGSQFHRLGQSRNPR